MDSGPSPEILKMGYLRQINIQNTGSRFLVRGVRLQR